MILNTKRSILVLKTMSLIVLSISCKSRDYNSKSHSSASTLQENGGREKGNLCNKETESILKEKFQPSWDFAQSQMESKSSVKESKLDKLEITSIIVYTGAAYDPINAHLRFGTEGEINWKPIADCIVQGLHKLPRFIGQVFRGAKITQGELEKFRSKSIIEERGFLSTSISEYLAYRWAGSMKNEPVPGSGEARAVFQIGSKTGRKISSFSASPNEEEVLFLPNTRFRAVEVVSAIEDSGAEYKVTLIEEE
ncbi:MAG: hypothetical protein IOD12_05085 [Silvanigrellales bacterium]|jgi:hypothetical protein|nr:hypothetical protein [Silvanigrellales bacterium]